jgi:hypothetical protein
MNENRIPFHFLSRTYQQPLIRAVNASIKGESPIRYFLQIWHRRSGKDKTDIADCIPRRLIQDPCLVKMVYPTLVMGRENLWDGIGSDGFRYRDHIPEGLRVGQPNETTMKMLVQTKQYAVDKSTSIFQVGGSDHPDSLRGGNPKMIVFSEWSEQDPYAWDVTEPILKENNGIAIFNMTPKGDNHARGMYEYAKNNPLWWVQTLTATDTGIWSKEELEGIRIDIIKRFSANGRSESEASAYFEQEYMCSFTSAVIGAYYGEGIKRAEREHRITHVPYAEGFPVHTAWDLGIDDSMTIWFFQVIGQEFHFIDYYENSGEGLSHYAMVMQDKKYVYGKHYAPHDIMVRELGTGKSRFEVAKGFGISFIPAPALAIDDGINAARGIFSQCWFDADKCHRGVNCLKNYRKEWDEQNKVFKNKPKHDWASHGADAFRRFAVGYRKVMAPSIQTTPGGVLPFFPGIG